MNGWDIAANLTNLGSRLPIERLLERNRFKGFEAFECDVREKGLLHETKKTLSSHPKPVQNRITEPPSPIRSYATADTEHRMVAWLSRQTAPCLASSQRRLSK